MNELRVRSLEEAEQLLISQNIRIENLEQLVRDHDQRFDTLQSPLWKRIWFKINGWPWYDLNGVQKKRFWHRDR